MTDQQQTLAPLDVDAVAAAIDWPFERWAHQCHAVSLAIVRAGFVPGGRVARGTCTGVMSQHSWIVAGDDCYAADARIIDPTLWSYDSAVDGVWYGTARDGRHVPHGGTGSIWTYGKPTHAGGDTITLTPAEPLSAEARRFLRMVEPLDRTGWSVLLHAPVDGWPAGEIVAAASDTPALAALVPIDLLGMLTDRNPSGGYR